MGNRAAYGPARGEAANQYHLPSEKARQQALNQQKLARTLQAQGRHGLGPKQTLQKVATGTLVPAAYHTSETGEIVTDAAIERDPIPYEHIFTKAKQEALTIQLQYEDCSAEDLLLIHLFVIQQAIDTLLRPDQTHAEGNMQRLVEETTQTGDTTMSTAEVKALEAEVCTMKSMIAQHYLQEHCPAVHVTMVSETAYKGGNEGHNYLHLEQGGTLYEYHANSPHQGVPHVTGISPTQEKLLQTVQDMKRENQKQPLSFPISHLGHNVYRLAA